MRNQTRIVSAALVIGGLTLLLSVDAIAAEAAQPRRWVVGSEARLRQSDPGLRSFCEKMVPMKATLGMKAPAKGESFDSWLANLKGGDPELAKCFDPGEVIPVGTAGTILDARETCGSSAVRLRLQDGRIGCINGDFLSDERPR